MKPKGEAEARRIDTRVCSCGPGSRAAAVVGGRLRLISAGAPGLPVTKLVLPMPEGRRVIACDSDGPSILCSDGSLHVWSARDSRWNFVGSLLEGE